MPKKLKQDAEKHFFGFTGMNNIKGMGEHQLDDRHRVVPRYVLNADVHEDGRIHPRSGYDKKISLTNCHSAFDGSVKLCVADGAAGTPSLFRIDGPVTATEICTVDGPLGAQMYYAEAERKVYLSNGYWKHVYDMDDRSASAWGLPLPPMPVAIPCVGNLPSGRYSMCFTYYSGERIGGNGPALDVAWDGGESGIKVLNQPADAYFWLTQPDGDTYRLVSPVNGEVSEPYYFQPLPTLDVTEVPLLKYLAVAHGRLWGVKDQILYFSEPFRYEWFKNANREFFFDELTMVAPFVGGVFVNSMDTTWAIYGTEPLGWEIRKMSSGGIPGTLVYALMPDAGADINRTQSKVLTPVWMGTKGMVAGTSNGHLVHITEGRLMINHRNQGAAFYRQVNGYPQIVMSLRGAYDKPADVTLSKIFRTGKLN